MVRLLGIGDNTVDIYLTEEMQYPGGNAVNVAVHARRNGAEASYLGCLGQDILGDLVFESLASEGVDVSRVRRIKGPNPWSRIRHQNGDRIFIGSNPGVRDRYDLTADDLAFIITHDLVHTTVHSGSRCADPGDQAVRACTVLRLFRALETARRRRDDATGRYCVPFWRVSQ